MPTWKLQKVEEGSCKDWGLTALPDSFFIFCRAHLPKPTEVKNKCQFLDCLASLLLGDWPVFPSWPMGPETKPDKDICQKFPPWGKRKRKKKHTFLHFYYFTYCLCEAMMLVLWQLFLDHEDRAKGITEKLKWSPDIAEPPNESWNYPESFLCEAKKKTPKKTKKQKKNPFISKPLSFYFFCFLKPKVSYLT